MSQRFIDNGRARLPESLDDSGNLERVPYQDGVRYQAQAARLVHDLLVIPSAKFTLVGEKDPASQTVPVLFNCSWTRCLKSSSLKYFRMYMVFTTRPSMVNAFARRSEGELLANRCTTTWAGQTRFLSEAATRTS